MAGAMRPLGDIEADWPRISGLLDELMNLPPASRETFISALLPPDARLADTLRELLALQAKVETEEFMDDLPVFPGISDPAAVVGVAAAGTAGAGGLVEGAEVGPYRLLRPIGEGGMGAVWLAERADGTLKRKVALKLPRLAWAQDLAARMARERDILAGLEHPNIARLYDAGLDAQGRPWLALEFVEGRDLTTYCDAERLDLRARVQLFMQVLDAVQYAHASLVIHRDIKPANILVTPRGEARLLDFGIARLEEGAAEAGPDLTRTGVSAMTPRYASPEQVQGARLTVASDLYSLGVVLHELLTGETPYVLRRPSRAELEQAILDADLRVPSRLKVTVDAATARATAPERIARDLRGDLDAVLLRALARAPAARYASAAAFRDDLRRWLEGRTVTALPPSRLHSLRKFVARNRLSVAASAAAALALVAVSVVAVLQAQRATRSAELARAEAAKANATKDFLLSTYASADPTTRGGRDATAKELLVEAERQLDTKLGQQPALRVEVLETLDTVWKMLGEFESAERAQEKRATLLLAMGDRRGAAVSMVESAHRAIARGDLVAADSKLTRLDEVVALNALPELMQGKIHYARGFIAAQRGDVGGAEAHFDRGESALDGPLPDDPQARVLYFQLMTTRALMIPSSEDREGLLADLSEAEALVGHLDADSVEYHANRAQLAKARFILGDYARGWVDMQDVIRHAERNFSADNANLMEIRLWWLAYCIRLDRPELVRGWWRSIDGPRSDDGLGEYAGDFDLRVQMARAMALDGDWRSVDVHLRAARSLAPRPGGPERLGGDALRQAVRLMRLDAEIALRRGRLDEARPLLERVRRTAGDEPALARESRMSAWMLGVVERESGDISKALSWFEIAHAESVSALGASHPETALLRLDIALAEAMRSGSESDPRIVQLLRGSSSTLRESLPRPHPALKFVDQLLPMGEGGSGRGATSLRPLPSVEEGRFFF